VKEPIISYSLFKNRLYATSILCALFSGAAFIVASVYIPIFIQGVLGGSATNSGLVLLPMMVGTVITATLGGFLMTKMPYRNVMIPTLAILVAGTALVATLTSDSTKFIVTIYMIMIGLGIGASFSVLSNASIHGLSVKQRGTATSTLNFIRSLGMTIGITTFGIIQSHLFANKLKGLMPAGGGETQMPEGLDFKDPHALLTPETRALIPSDLLHKITEMLSSSIVSTFAWAIIPAVLALLAALFMGRKKLDATAESPEYASGH
jgi:MFS family permease